MCGENGALGVVGGREDCSVGSHSWRNSGEGVGAREGETLLQRSQRSRKR